MRKFGRFLPVAHFKNKARREVNRSKSPDSEGIEYQNLSGWVLLGDRV